MDDSTADRSANNLDTPSPADTFDKTVQWERKEAFDRIKGWSGIFCGLHATTFVYLCLGVASFDSGPTATAFLMILAAGLWLISLICAVMPIVIVFRHPHPLRWWMTALALLPWAIIATETAAVLALLWL